MEDTERVKPRRHISKALLIGIIALVLLVGILVAVRLASLNKLSKERFAATGVLPGLTTEEIQQRLDQIVDEGMFNASINSVIHFADGNAAGDVRIENIEANRYACTVTIYLKNTNEAILTTGLILPGQYVEYMKLDKPLVDGYFDCTAEFTAYTVDTQRQVGTVYAEVVLLVG